MPAQTSKLVIIGQGYVGLPLALRAAEVGIKVVGLDIDESVAERLNAGASHIDDVSDEQLAAALQQGFRASTDAGELRDADAIVVCVPTPLSSDGGPDLRPVEGAARMIGENLSADTVVVLESTTYPGTTEEVFAPLVLGDRDPAAENIHIAFSPERVDPGNGRFGIQNTAKVVGGLTPEATDRAVALYGQFVDTVVPAKGAREAEMAKLLENTFRHVNIALVNEMVRFCDELDIDLWDAIDAASTKPFGFMPFRPGPGVGGHCIPVDPSYLSHRVKAQLGYSFRMVELAEEINLAAPVYVATRAWQMLNDAERSMRGARVLLVGVTYKPDIADLRESPATPLAKRLTTWGVDLAFFDPLVQTWRLGDQQLTSEPDLYAAAAQADLTILLQPHQEIDLDRLARESKRLLDTRGVLSEDGERVRRL